MDMGEIFNEELNADQTQEGKKVARNNVNKYCDLKCYPKLPDDTVNTEGVMTAEFFCREEFFYGYANYLCKIYKTQKDENLMMQTVTQYLGRVLMLGANYFRDNWQLV